MAEQDGAPIIVVKKVKKCAHAHHGGAWKIAYADFVTAMMAFFLLMWLLGSTAEADLKGISDYFNNPLKVALMGGPGSGTATSIISGGGTDLTREFGQIRRGSKAQNSASTQEDSFNQAADRIEEQRLSEIKGQIENLIERSSLLKEYENQIQLDITQEGLRIQIVDEKNRPMFDRGSAVLKEHMKEILKSLTTVVMEVGNKITLSGYTDAIAYASGGRGYSNWELSVDRANATRRQMIAFGMPENKVMRVVGLASSVPLNKDDPSADVNRRIAIVVMNKRTENAVINSSASQPARSGSGIGVQLPALPNLKEPVAN